MQPEISVIIPTYNRAHYVVDAVRSALLQHEVHTEVIVVDDGSTDQTAERLAPFRDRIRYVRQPNRGAAAARNTGIRLAHADYVAFLDADDVWEPGKLALQLAYLRQHPELGLVCTDFGAFNDDGPLAESFIERFCLVVGKKGRRFDRIYPIREQFEFGGRRIDAYRGHVLDTTLEGYFTLTSTVVARKTWLAEAGLFPENVRSAEDYICYMNLSRTRPFGFLDVPTVRYRIGHVDQLSGPGYQVEAAYARIEAIQKLVREDTEYAARNGKHIRSALRLHRWTLAHYLWVNGDYREASRVLLQTIADHPWQKRAYFYVAAAWLRSLHLPRPLHA